jgi:hypothetical protein
MKVEDLARGGLVVLGVAAGALLGFAAGVAYARDPQVLRRTAARYLRGAAQGVEQATLMAAQAREHVADLWAEAREEALADVDAADFARRAAAAGAAAPAAAPARPAAKRARKPAATAAAASAAKKATRRTRKAASTAPAAADGPAAPAEAG